MWIRFPNLDFSYWPQDAMDRLVSVVGVPVEAIASTSEENNANAQKLECTQDVRENAIKTVPIAFGAQ